MKNDGMSYVKRIRKEGLSLYDTVAREDARFWIPTKILEHLLNNALKGFSLEGLALRSRSRRLKVLVCAALGYPIPKSFKRTKPRFPGQDLDVYGMRANNLQIWNEEVAPNRRYALVRIGEDRTILRVRVIEGSVLQKLDKTGTLTRKYQSRYVPSEIAAELVSLEEAPHVQALYCQTLSGKPCIIKNTHPSQRGFSIGNGASGVSLEGRLFPISFLFSKLQVLVGSSFENLAADQDRNRGGILHKRVCEVLGCTSVDTGQIPDIPEQLLEVKLQTSPTIDLGLASPDSTEVLPNVAARKHGIRYCDLRYAVFGAILEGNRVTVKSLTLIVGLDFYSKFRQFGGRVKNTKIQIPLPRGFL